MPIFNRTVECVGGAVNRENCTVSELAWAILEDPTLTAQVLKTANSIYYNPSSKRIATVSRAVVQLGTDVIKGICLSIALVEMVLSSLHKEKVAAEVARAFHSAVQAKKLAVQLNLPVPEEVFIAALLTRIGNIAFWCFAGEVGEELEKEMLGSECEDQAEIKILGFKLERLTLRLSQEWRLSHLLEGALQDRKGIDPRIRSIKLGCEVAQASENGWESPQAGKVIREISDFLRLPKEKATEILYESARAAAEITESCGVKNISRLVPIPVSATAISSLTVVQETKIEEEYRNPDPNIQLCSIRDLSNLVTSGRASVNLVLSIVLEGIYRGIGMDRVFFALLTPDRKTLKIKYSLGWKDGDAIDGFCISANSDTPNVFESLLTNRKPVWQKPDNKGIKSLIVDEVANITGGGQFFAMPVFIKEAAIGVIYSDRDRSHRDLDEESFESFVFFGRQASMSLSMVSSGLT